MSYPGGKSGDGVYQAIINQIPPHHTYVEAFAGGGAVLKLKRPAASNIAIESNLNVCAGLWGCVPNIAVLNLDAIPLLERPHPALTERDTFLYLDPPYPLETRTSHFRYPHELKPIDHRRLLAAIRRLPCMVMVCSYTHPTYALALADWRLVTYTGTTRGGPREECLWCNYAAPTALHDYRYVGQDYRERERIKKKRDRWRAMLLEMPPLERRAVLSHVADLLDHTAAEAGAVHTTTPTGPGQPRRRRR